MRLRGSVAAMVVLECPLGGDCGAGRGGGAWVSPDLSYILAVRERSLHLQYIHHTPAHQTEPGESLTTRITRALQTGRTKLVELGIVHYLIVILKVMSEQDLRSYIISFVLSS